MGKISSKSSRKLKRFGYILFIAFVIIISIFLAFYSANGEWWQTKLTSNTNTVEYATFLFSMIAATFGIFTFYKQLDEGNKTSNAQFLIELRNMFATPERMKIHSIIQTNNEQAIKTYTPQKNELQQEIDQDGREELLDDYLGLFEFCKLLIDKGSLSEEDFLTFYKYRLENILKSDAIMEKFECEKKYWRSLFELILDLQDQLEIGHDKIVKIENFIK